MKNDSFRDFVLDQLAELDVSARSMFGAHGLYLGDKFFGIISRGRLYFKTNEKTRQGYIERGMGPFVASKKQILKNYYEVPPEIIENPNELKSWAEEAAF